MLGFSVKIAIKSPANRQTLTASRLTRERALANLRVLQSRQLEGKLTPARSWCRLSGRRRSHLSGRPLLRHSRPRGRAGERIAALEELKAILGSQMRELLTAVASGQFLRSAFWDLLRESARSAPLRRPRLSVCKWSEQHLVLSHFSRLAGIYKVIYTLRELCWTRLGPYSPEIPRGWC